jgi:hypothetical protein
LRRGVVSFFVTSFVAGMRVADWKARYGEESVSRGEPRKGIIVDLDPDLDPERMDTLGNADIDNIEFGIPRGEGVSWLSSGTEFPMDVPLARS